MIQRIQSIYLLLAALSYTAAVLLPVMQQGVAAAQLAWFQPTATVVGALAALVALVCIFLYSDRTRQRNVALGGQYVGLLFALIVFLGLYMGGALDPPAVEAAPAQTVLALGLPLFGYLMYRLARRGIDRDIARVRSMDRLR